MKKTCCQLNYAIPPGETLRETLESIGMTQTELAKRSGHPKKTINEIIAGKTTITADTALQLERVLRVPASFWNSPEKTYQETKERLSLPYRNRLQNLQSLIGGPIDNAAPFSKGAKNNRDCS